MKTEVHTAKDPRQFARVWRKVELGIIRGLGPTLPQKMYMDWLITLLRKHGMNITGTPIYISSKCIFDGTDYGLITIEDRVVISSHVSVLTHDFSLARTRDALAGARRLPEVALVKGVRIGANSFVGRGTILMPGSNIGLNCIIGAGSVVRGTVPDNSIVLGNPAQVIGNSLEWGERKLKELNFPV